MGQPWDVREEKRSGPFPQLLVLTHENGTSEMHVRSAAGAEARALEDVEPLAMNPTYRWFVDSKQKRWEVRRVLTDTPPGVGIKFISWTDGVYEGPYAFNDGIGCRTDDELRQLLERLRDGT